jgi:TonB family protein
MVVSLGGRAGEVFLIPEKNPKPEYPLAHYRAGITGEVRVSFKVHSDGSVTHVVASKGADPEFAQASLKAVNKWRYQPWEATPERPAKVEVTAPMVFRLDDKLPIHANEQLKELTCGDVAKSALKIAHYSWVDLPVFNWTRSYMTYSISPTQLPDEKRLALIAKLNESVPSIIRRCNTHQATRFVRFLPTEIRELL